MPYCLTYSMSNQKTIKEITEEIQAHQKAIVDLANMAGNQILEKLKASAGQVGLVVVKK